MIRAVTQCSQFFHNVEITGLEPDTTYYYQIPASNGTTESDVLSFRTARPAGDSKGFTALVINDMGYTNAQGTHKYLEKAVDDGASFAWHGGERGRTRKSTTSRRGSATASPSTRVGRASTKRGEAWPAAWRR